MIDLCPVGALTSKPYAYTARPWELKRTKSVDVLDAIGAPIWVDTRAGKVLRVLPQENAAINEEWLTDAARFSYDALANNRLTTPLIKGKPASWPEAFAAVKKIMAKAEGKVGVALGEMQSAENAYSVQQFAKLIGAKYLAALPTGRTLGLPFTLAMPLADFDKAEAVLLLGCNPRREAPLLNVRLRRGVLKRTLKVYNIGAVADLTYAHTQLGETATALADFKTDKPLHILVGAQALARPDAADLLAAANKLGTVHVLESSCGRITAQAMGAAQTEATELAKLWQSGMLNALWLHGDDTLSAEEIQAGEGSVIYCGTHHTAAAKLAEVCLPAAAWAEEAGLFMNAEGRVQEAKAAAPAPLQAKEAWKIYRALSEELGAAFAWNTQAQLRAALALANPAFATENFGKPQAMPVAPLNATSKLGTKKFTETIPAYYLRSTYLLQSDWMQKMQAEAGTAQIKRVA
jgi:NADH-quinone oxidoreductase subunit G